MQKLYIATNKFGKYYTKISNKYHKCDKLVSVSLPKDMVLGQDFGTYDCEYYLDCYPTRDGGVELAIRITKIVGANTNVTNPEINPQGTQALSPYEEYDNSISEELPF